MKTLHDYILVTEKAASDEELKTLLGFCVEQAAWKPSRIGLRGVADTSTRHCHTFVVPATPEFAQIDRLLFGIFHRAVPEYANRHPELYLDADTGYELLKYEPGGFYSWHVDHFDRHPRSLSALLFLNDDFKGGDLEFEGLTVRPAPGRVAIFPSNFMFKHRVTTVEEGTRYACVTWFI